MMAEEKIEALVEAAHSIFGETSIYEVIDLEDREAIGVLVDHYGPIDMKKVDRYLGFLHLLRYYETI
ncbi:MAG: hypothetical protein KJ630_05625 [Proteobacteria bacterium]|nr:hypothetical protein [Pseudomonadota bacterium]